MKTENQPQHTQGEWHATNSGKTIFAAGAGNIVRMTEGEGFDDEEQKANAHRIVTCVNMHDELVNALHIAQKHIIGDGRFVNRDDLKIIQSLLKQASSK